MHTTLKKDVTFTGVGLHGGRPVTMIVRPQAAGAGIVFKRTDISVGKNTIPARFDCVTDTTLCTRLTNDCGTSVGTVEHLMAALSGCGISDALVLLDGPEVPIMDGSSRDFVGAFERAGLVRYDRPLRAIRILRPISVRDGDKSAELFPADAFSIEFHIRFDDPAIGAQSHAMTMGDGDFVSDLSDCRTFGFLHEVEYLRSKGLAKGGGLHNAIVVDSGRVLNPEGLRRPDEFVRHKMLDAVGDLALAGAPIIGRYVGVKAGHGITNKLLHALFAAPDAWEWCEIDSVGDAAPFQFAVRRAGHQPAAIAV